MLWKNQHLPCGCGPPGTGRHSTHGKQYRPRSTPPTSYPVRWGKLHRDAAGGDSLRGPLWVRPRLGLRRQHPQPGQRAVSSASQSQGSGSNRGQTARSMSGSRLPASQSPSNRPGVGRGGIGCRHRGQGSFLHHRKVLCYLQVAQRTKFCLRFSQDSATLPITKRRRDTWNPRPPKPTRCFTTARRPP